MDTQDEPQSGEAQHQAQGQREAEAETALPSDPDLNQHDDDMEEHSHRHQHAPVPEQPTTIPIRTVKQLADEVRARAIEAYGEAQFARLCMEFAQELGEGGNPYILYVLVFRLLAHKQDPKTLQLAMVWLDGHGYGDLSIEAVTAEVQRIRSGAGTKPLTPTSVQFQFPQAQTQEQDREENEPETHY